MYVHIFMICEKTKNKQTKTHTKPTKTIKKNHLNTSIMLVGYYQYQI